jgi:hypothetical protein
LMHFEFTFVCGGRWGSNFILLHVDIQFSQHHLLKRPSFLLEWPQHTLSKIIWLYVRVYFWVSYFIPLVNMSVFMPEPFHSFVVSFEIRTCETFNVIILFLNCFGYFESLEIPYRFLSGLSISAKKILLDFCIKSLHHFLTS